MSSYVKNGKESMMKTSEYPQIRELEVPTEEMPGKPEKGPVVMNTEIPSNDDTGQVSDSVDQDPPGIDGYDPAYDRRKYH